MTPNNNRPDNNMNRWGEIRLRLAKADQALNEAQLPTPETNRKILAHRANLLARRLTDDDSKVAGNIEVFIFQLAGRDFAIETNYVLELLRAGSIARLPHLPMHLLGLMSVRGEIYLVTDLAAYNSTNTTGDDANKQNKMVLAIGESRPELLLLIDAPKGIEEISRAAWRANDALDFSQLKPNSDLIMLNGESLLQDSRFFFNRRLPNEFVHEEHSR